MYKFVPKIINYLYIAFFSFLFFVAIPTSVQAATITWDGGGSTNNWSEDANWSGDTEPGTGDLAYFDGTSTKNAIINTNIDVGGLDIDDGYTGIISAASGVDINIRGGGFVQLDGTFTSTNANMTLSGDNFIIDGGVFNHNNGTVRLRGDHGHTVNVEVTENFYNLTFDPQCNVVHFGLAAGTNLTVLNTLTLDNNSCFGANSFINGSGMITAKSNINLAHFGYKGGATLLIDGTGDQTITGENDANNYMPSININKSSGTLYFVNNVSFGNDFTYTNGNYNSGSGTFYFSPDHNQTTNITGSFSAPNITFSDQCVAAYVVINSGDTLTATGNVTAAGPCFGVFIYGQLNIQGNFTVTDLVGGTVAITLTGTNNQTINIASSLPDGVFAINKSSGTVTLASNINFDGSGQDLTITSGTLDMSTYNLTVNDVLTVNGGLKQGTGTLTVGGDVTVGSTGTFFNNSTGDMSFAGGKGVTNNGYIKWAGNGTCGGADDISISRSGSGQVTLSGSGIWKVYDITLATNSAFTASPALTFYSSTIGSGQTGITNNTTCPSEFVWVGNTSTDWGTASNWAGNAVPGSGDVAIFDGTTSNNASINSSINIAGIQIIGSYTGTITQSGSNTITIGSSGWTQSTGTFTGGSGNITIQSGGDFTLNGGTFTSTSGILTIGDDLTINGGTFTHNSGTIRFGAGADNAGTISGTATFYNVTIAPDNAFASAVLTLNTGSSFTVTGLLTFASGFNSQIILEGSGTLAAQGNITTTATNSYGGEGVLSQVDSRSINLLVP